MRKNQYGEQTALIYYMFEYKYGESGGLQLQKKCYDKITIIY